MTRLAAIPSQAPSKDTPSLEDLRAAVHRARADSDIAWAAFFSHDVEAEPWDDVRADAHWAAEADRYYHELEDRAIAAGVARDWW